MLPPGTGFIIAYILSPPELVESEKREREINEYIRYICMYNKHIDMS